MGTVEQLLARLEGMIVYFATKQAEVLVDTLADTGNGDHPPPERPLPAVGFKGNEGGA